MSTPADREARLAHAFVRLADTLVAGYDVVELLHDLADTCIELLNVDAAGIMLRHEGRLALAAYSSTAVRELEVFQIQSDEGPCRDCVETGEPVSVPDLGEATGRWPHFTEVALGRGLRSVHAIPLRLRADIIGGLNLFHHSVRAWSDADDVAGRALADVAAIGIIQERAIADARIVQAQLQGALDSRVLIEQAKGVLAEQGQISVDDAFTALRAYCRGHNVTLQDTARRVVAGELDAAAIAVAAPKATRHGPRP